MHYHTSYQTEQIKQDKCMERCELKGEVASLLLR